MPDTEQEYMWQVRKTYERHHEGSEICKLSWVELDVCDGDDRSLFCHNFDNDISTGGSPGEWDQKLPHHLGVVN